MTLAPILLFVYNRPEHVRRGVASLLANDLAGESELFVYSDAAKDEAAAIVSREIQGPPVQILANSSGEIMRKGAERKTLPPHFSHRND